MKNIVTGAGIIQKIIGQPFPNFRKEAIKTYRQSKTSEISLVCGYLFPR